MTLIRQIAGIIAGYAIFVITALALFKLSGQDPHGDPTPAFILLAAAYGILFSLMAGFVAQLLSGTGTLTVNYILAFIMAGFATFSFFKSDGNHWSQVLAIFTFAPASLIGGLFYMKRCKKF